MLVLTILGNNSSIPAHGRNPTAQALQTLDETFLIDCGEGTQQQMNRFKIKRGKLNNIFISHLHGDHYFGLIGLLTSMSLMGRTADLHLYAPATLETIIDLQLKAADSNLSYKIHFHALNAEGEIYDGKKIIVSAFKVYHRIECWGFLFKEKKKLKHINAERAKAYEIPASYFEQLQAGKDYVTKKGTIIPNEEVTIPAAAPKSYAFCADTLFDERVAEKVSGVNLLYHETTYLKDLEERATIRFHSTTVQAGQIATIAGVEKLLIGHFSSKYEDLGIFLEETKLVFSNTELALEGCCYKI